MLTQAEREAIARIWTEKLSQDALELPKSERHRNLEPASAEFLERFLALLKLAPGGDGTV